MAAVLRVRKKPIVVEAIRFTGINRAAVLEWCSDAFATSGDQSIGIETLEGDMVATSGDYIIKGVNGEFYPCKPDIFEKTYEVIGAVSL